MTRYWCVDARKAEGFTVVAACAAVEVSTSGFYEWLARRDAPPTQRVLDGACQIFCVSGRDGYR